MLSRVIKSHHKVIIIGSGPAAYTAAIYAARAELQPLLFEGKLPAVTPGGQLTTTTDIENFPGFEHGIGGFDLVEVMKKQSERFGTTVIGEMVTEADLKVKPFLLKDSENTWYSADSVIVATGATAKRLSFPGADKYWNNGVSACAVCDGALPIFRNKQMAVIGGGDSACEEATFLTKFGSKVFLLVRRNVLRASKIMQQRVLNNPKIEILWDSEVAECYGDEKGLLSSAKIISTKKEAPPAPYTVPIAGLFFAVGHEPGTKFLNNQLHTDADGYIITKPGTTETSIEGVFAAGDVQDRQWRQAITAAGTGCMAALQAEHYISSHSSSHL